MGAVLVPCSWGLKVHRSVRVNSLALPCAPCVRWYHPPGLRGWGIRGWSPGFWSSCPHHWVLCPSWPRHRALSANRAKSIFVEWMNALGIWGGGWGGGSAGEMNLRRDENIPWIYERSRAQFRDVENPLAFLCLGQKSKQLFRSLVLNVENTASWQSASRSCLVVGISSVLPAV